MPNQRKSEARQKKLQNYTGSRKVAKTWGKGWRMLNTAYGEKDPDLTPPQLQGKKVVVQKA